MAQQRVERRLAAVLAADVAGYRRLMGAEEVGMLRALKADREEPFDPVLAEHHGRIVKLTGDGILIEFARAVDALSWAASVQQTVAGYSTGSAHRLSRGHRHSETIGS